MNLRQKRKHFRYSLITFTIKIFGMDNIFTKRKLRRYTKEKLKINNNYDYADSCYRHYFLGFYGDVKPKFMRSKSDEVEKKIEGIGHDW